jgi:signal transduction histidine kinase
MDGPEALTMSQLISYDLVILDVMLPHIDGFEVCKRLRKRGLTMPILFLILRLDVLAEAVVTTLEPLAAERGIALQKQIETNVIVLGDEARLMQVVMNLLDNALTYTDRGGNVMLLLEKTCTHVLLRVRDTRCGIPEEHLPHIFERFYRVDRARSRSAGGAGLGLAITKWIVTMHDGTMTVESYPGKGSQFSVILPLVKDTTL